MVYKDDPELSGHEVDEEDQESSCQEKMIKQPVSSFDPIPLSDGNGRSATGIRNNACIALCLGACFFAGVVWAGAEAGMVQVSIRTPKPAPSSNDHLDINQHQHVRAPAASMTEASALDLLEERGTGAATALVDFDAAIEDLSSIDNTLLQFLAGSPFARERTIELLSAEYVSEDASDTGEDRLEDAIEVMESMKTDGEPVQVKGHPFLFVGSVGAAMNHEALQRKGITHVIGLSKTSKCDNYPDIHYMCIKDILTYKDMRKHMDELDRAVDYIESARRAGGRVMSQCWYGRNRSVTVLVAYLMKYEGMDSEDALGLIQETRPIADSYRDVVKSYGKHYLNGEGGGGGKANKHDHV